MGFLGSLVRDGAGHWSADQWLSAIATFLVVIHVWNEYRMTVTLWAGVPVLQDSVVPFTLGALEYWLIFAIPDPAVWLLAFAFFSSSGVIAYARARRLQYLPENHEAAVHRPYVRAQLWWALGSGSLYLGLSFVSRTGMGISARYVSCAIAVAVVGVLLLRSELHWRRVLQVVDAWEA